MKQDFGPRGVMAGGQMGPVKSVELEYPDTVEREAGAKVYKFGMRQTQSSRHLQIRMLREENELLTRVLSETRTEVEHLRTLLLAR